MKLTQMIWFNLLATALWFCCITLQHYCA